MTPIKVLNLYAGIGGNRKLWKDVEVTAIENVPEIARIYKDFFPEDKVIITDAHQYLLEHFKEYDFIWSSPPCPTHSRFRFNSRYRYEQPIYPCMKLYEEILFLKYYFKGRWVVENVRSYYDPLIRPYEVQRHYFWSNFIISKIKLECDQVDGSIEIQSKIKGFNLDKYEFINSNMKDTLLSNCVLPRLGLHIFNCAFKTKQTTLKND